MARSGKFLRARLTFGPTNDPDDFSYVVDRMYAPGRSRRMRLGREWLAYVDDLTVRSGRVVDGVAYRDCEYDQELKEACRRVPQVPPQAPHEALEALGFNPAGLGEEADARRSKRKYDPVSADRNHPFANGFAGIVTLGIFGILGNFGVLRDGVTFLRTRTSRTIFALWYFWCFVGAPVVVCSQSCQIQLYSHSDFFLFCSRFA